MKPTSENQLDFFRAPIPPRPKTKPLFADLPGPDEYSPEKDKTPYLRRLAEREGKRQPLIDSERELRDLWDAKGVPKERQEELIKDLEAKAKPGAMVGPFRIGKRPQPPER